MKQVLIGLAVALCLATGSFTAVVAAETKAASKQVAPVSINTAGVKELQALPGIGKVTAQRIVEWRKANGSFKSAADLQKVKGIGAKSIEKLKPLIAFK